MVWWLGWKTAVLVRRVHIHLVISEFFFSFKIQETCTLTTCVEQKLSLSVKLRNFMRVYVNRERAVWDMHEASLLTDKTKKKFRKFRRQSKKPPSLRLRGLIITDKETTVDPIRCLAVMKLARSVFAHKNQFYSLRYSVHVSHQAYSYEIYAVEICLGSQLCLCGPINGPIKITVLQIAQYTKFCSVFGIASWIKKASLAEQLVPMVWTSAKKPFNCFPLLRQFII